MHFNWSWVFLDDSLICRQSGCFTLSTDWQITGLNYSNSFQITRNNWLPISICLDMSASYAIFEPLTSYVSVLTLLMRGYSLKCTYCINFLYLFNLGNFVFCIHLLQSPKYNFLLTDLNTLLALTLGNGSVFVSHRCLNFVND